MPKKYGYWNDFDNLKKELLVFIAECDTVGVIPTRGELKKAGRGDLITGIDRHGGVYAVAERLNLVVTTKQKGHWNDFRNVESAIIAFNEKNGTPGVMPTAEQLRQAGQGAFVQAICKKHEGFENVAQRMGLKFTLTDKPPNYWDDFYNVKQAIFEFIDLQGVSGVIPTQSELRKAGKSGLGRAISKHGGWQSVAERLGLAYSQKKPGYWDLDKLQHEILDFNEKNANSGFMPTGKQLRQFGRSDIENAIQKNGGQQIVAEKLGLTYAKKKAKYWHEFSNLKSEILNFIEKQGILGVMPTKLKLDKAGRSELTAAIYKHGGFLVVGEKLGLEMIYEKKPHGYWQEFSNFETEIISFIEEYGNFGVMPTHTELQKTGRTDLIDAIKQHGGFPLVAEKLNLQLSYQKWTLKAIRKFVASLIEHLETFTSAELYIIFQQSGLGKIDGKGKSFVKALTTGRFPKEELEKFVNGEPSVVDNFLEDKQLTLETLETNSNNNIPDRDTISSDEIDATVEALDEQEDLTLPLVQTREVLASLNHHVVSSADEEAVEFLIASAKAKIWQHTFIDETAALAQAETYTGDSYAEKVKSEFLDEYHRAKNLPIPSGYNFYSPPNLMQRLAAVQLRDKKRVGNWSGTGAGKTLSAILASRVINASLTVICCPNSVVDGWEKAILNIFPHSKVAKKTFTPDWTIPNSLVLSANRDFEGKVNKYLLLNYEMFQQPDSANRVRSLLENEQIDFIVIDEIHYTKQRQVDDMSQRKQLIQALITAANERNPDLHIIGMSATPVINNLQEGKSLVELVTGVAHDEIDIRPTLPNCMRLHQRLVTLGIRWMPQYKQAYEQIEIPVDCGEFLDDIRALGRNGSPLALEKILTLARLPVICQHIQPKTLIYTHYVEGIDRLLRDALEAEGWKVGFYTGEDKSGLEGFLHGKIDVLIGSSAIGTGVDGLQQVCNRLIINVLPWTHAEFEQLKGRIYRQGQRQDNVTIIMPLTYAMVNNERWSWCDSKMQRLKFKKSIADAAVDGVVPEGHLRSPAQTYQDVIAWLERMETGQVEVITRPKIIIPLPDNPVEVHQRQKRYGDFSTMNHHWNQSRSETTHQRLKENPEEWMQYHTLYREARKDWAVIPYEEMIRWCQQRSGYTIGDFGCGEAKLASAVCDRHTVYSFDHIAINENVIICDIAHVPLDDKTLDVAIFSLSLMGSNFTDYLQEAHRTLKLDGTLHIIEATSRFSDIDKFRNDLQALGFEVMQPKQISKFTHIRAIKSDLKPQMQIELRL